MAVTFVTRANRDNLRLLIELQCSSRDLGADPPWITSYDSSVARLGPTHRVYLGHDVHS
jgi:hypothetical protein